MIWSNIKNEKILIKKVTEYSKYETEVKYLSFIIKIRKLNLK
jgi:hypothetical protein